MVSKLLIVFNYLFYSLNKSNKMIYYQLFRLEFDVFWELLLIEDVKPLSGDLPFILLFITLSFSVPYLFSMLSSKGTTKFFNAGIGLN